MKNLVRERFDLAKNKMCSMNQKLATGLATAATMFGVPVNVYADTEFKPATTQGGSNIVKNLITVVGNILTWAGVLVLIA